MSQSGTYEDNVSPGTQPVLALEGNDSVVVPADPATGVVNVIGASGISTSGDAGTYTLTITGSSSGSTINGDYGSIAGPDVTIYADQADLNCGATVQFNNSGTVSTLQVSDSNSNTIIGNGSGNNSYGGSYNTVLGTAALTSLVDGSYNYAACYSALANLTNGSYNYALGVYSLDGIDVGNYNIGIGYGSGNAYNGGESNNIVLNGPGITGDQNILRIGNGTGTGTQQLQSAYICGIDSVNLNTANVVVEVSDQLGTAVLTAGPGISIAAGTNSITISGTGGGAAWVDVTSSTQSMDPDTGYVCDNGASLITFTLPVTAAFGTIIRIVGNSSGGWALNQNSSQQVLLEGSATTSGTGGSASSTNAGDCIEMVCITENTIWRIASSVGNITII